MPTIAVWHFARHVVAWCGHEVNRPATLHQFREVLAVPVDARRSRRRRMLVDAEKSPPLRRVCRSSQARTDDLPRTPPGERSRGASLRHSWARPLCNAAAGVPTPELSSCRVDSVRPTARAPEDEPATNEKYPDQADSCKIEAGEREGSRWCARAGSGRAEVARGRRSGRVARDNGVTTEGIAHEDESGCDNGPDQKCALQPFSLQAVDGGRSIRKL